MRALITHDPVTGNALIVTRLACPASGISIEGQFSLGWPARLTPEQLDFVRVLVLNRGNVQRVAASFGMAYNTARARMDDIVAALEGPAPDDRAAARRTTLDQLAAGDIDFAQALRQLTGA